MERKDRFDLSPRLKPSGKVRDLQLTPERLKLLYLFEDFKLIPTNWAPAFFDVGYSTVAHVLSRMTYKPYQYVDRRTFHGDDNRNETMTYSRSEKGDAILRERGYDVLPRSRKQDEEQALVDLVRMSHALGAKADNTTLLFKKDYYGHSRHKAVYDQIYKDGKPNRLQFSFQVYGERIIPDEFPIIQVRNLHGITIIDEMDAHTKYDMERLREKILKYKRFIEDGLYSKYGFPYPYVRFTTTSEVRKRHIIQKLSLGPLDWLLFASIEDHTKRRFTQEVTTRFYTEPYDRIGYPPFSLKTMGDA